MSPTADTRGPCFIVRLLTALARSRDPAAPPALRTLAAVCAALVAHDAGPDSRAAACAIARLAAVRASLPRAASSDTAAAQGVRGRGELGGGCDRSECAPAVYVADPHANWCVLSSAARGGSWCRRRVWPVPRGRVLQPRMRPGCRCRAARPLPARAGPAPHPARPQVCVGRVTV
jgi:hypothetical protein